MSWKLTSTQTAISLFLIPCVVGWAWHLEAKSSENTLKIEEVKEDVKSLEDSISDMEDKLDEKAARDNANFLLVLGRIYDLKVEMAKQGNK